MADRIDSSRTVGCAIERRLYAAGELKGRIELVLGHAELRLFIEVKLHSDYRPNQLRDYLQAIDPGLGEFVVAVTRNISRFREPPSDEPGWLGSVRWARLAAALRDLPTRGTLRDQWNLLVHVLEGDGDLGSTKLTDDLITAYERSDEAYSRLSDFLEQVCVGALHRLRAELNDGDATDRSVAASRPRKAPSRPGKKQAQSDVDKDHPEVVWDDDGGLYLAFNVPSPGAERVWIGFYVADQRSWFYIAVGWSGPGDPSPDWEARWRAASSSLSAQFEGQRMFCDEYDELYFQVDYPLADFLNITDAPEALSGRIEEARPRSVGSGLFAGDL